MFRWLRRRREDRVSDDWLLEQRAREARAGVDLPRWRLPAEIREMNRKARAGALHLARLEQRREKGA